MQSRRSTIRAHVGGEERACKTSVRIVREETSFASEDLRKGEASKEVTRHIASQLSRQRRSWILCEKEYFVTREGRRL